MEHFGDPSFKYSVAATQVYGTLALRLADADLLPFDYKEYAKAIQKYVRDLEDEMKKDGAGDKLSFEEVTRAAAKFGVAANALASKMDTTSQAGMTDAGRLASFNHALIGVERSFLLPNGLPDRAWFRHAFYAPGVYTGYAAVVMPGVREAARRKDWATAAQQLRLVQSAIERGTVTLTQALQTLEEGGAASGKAPGM